jgi:hypothetical protein
MTRKPPPSFSPVTETDLYREETAEVGAGASVNTITPSDGVEMEVETHDTITDIIVTALNSELDAGLTTTETATDNTEIE